MLRSMEDWMATNNKHKNGLSHKGFLKLSYASSKQNYIQMRYNTVFMN